MNKRSTLGSDNIIEREMIKKEIKSNSLTYFNKETVFKHCTLGVIIIQAFFFLSFSSKQVTSSF